MALKKRWFANKGTDSAKEKLSAIVRLSEFATAIFERSPFSVLQSQTKSFQSDHTPPPVEGLYIFLKEDKNAK